MIAIPLVLKGVGGVVWGGLKKIPLTAWAVAGGLFLFWGYGHLQYRAGQENTQQKWDQSVKRGKTIVAQLKKEQGKVTIKYQTQYVDRVKVIHEKGKVIRDLIPTYIAADSCDLPPGFRLLHDAAASNSIPGAPEGTNAAAVPVRVATKTITDNYESCHEVSERLVNLQGWVLEQRQAYLELCKQPGSSCN